jgi:hypothetical protein
MMVGKKGRYRRRTGGNTDNFLRQWLHSQQSVLILDCVALARLFFDILRTSAVGTSKTRIGRERTWRA